MSAYRSWKQLSYAQEWLLFPENIGPYLSMDETALPNGELYPTNKEGHSRKGNLISVVTGTKSEDVIEVPEKISEEERIAVREVTLDLSESMNRTVRSCFPKASRVIDRFHVRKPACDAVQQIRIKHR